MKTIGVIGAGKIVPFHIDSLRKAGFLIEAIGATPGSINSKSLGEKFQIPRVFDDYKKIIDSNVDALLIAVSKEALLPILKESLSSNKKILIEKPVFLESKNLELDSKYSNNVMVAYNRRFYRTVALLKNRIANARFGSFYFHIPELSWSANPNMQNVLETLQGNTVHYLDLLSYVLKDKKLRSCFSDGSDIFDNLSKFIFLDYGNIKGILHITFGNPGNYRFDFQDGSILSSLSPIEMYVEFNRMVIEEPSREIPIRRYRPINSDPDFKATTEDSQFKPGFLGQSNEFLRFVNGMTLSKGASLMDASRATRFANFIASNSSDSSDLLGLLMESFPKE